MLFSEWYNKQCIHKNWQSYTQMNRGTICAKELPFRSDSNCTQGSKLWSDSNCTDQAGIR